MISCVCLWVRIAYTCVGFCDVWFGRVSCNVVCLVDCLCMVACLLATDSYVCVCLCVVYHLAQFGCLPARLHANCLRACLLLCRAVVHRVVPVCIGVLWFGLVCVG